MRRVAYPVLALSLLACAAKVASPTLDVEQPTSGPTQAFVEQPPTHVDAEEASRALLSAAKRGDLEEVRRLAAVPGVDVDRATKTEFTANHATNGFTPLAFAAYRGNIEMFEVLLSRGASVRGHVLHAAAIGGEIEIVRRVVELGIDDPDSLTSALVNACAQLERDVVEYLLGVGADIDGWGWAGGEFKSTCLVEATRTEDLDMVEFVLASGASVNTPEEAGFTPLMVAAGNGLLECTKRLLAAGADRELVNVLGERAVDLAEPGSEIAALLKPKRRSKSKI